MATSDRAVTQRPSSSALFTIDSEDRFADYIAKRSGAGGSSSPYNFRIIKPSLLNGFLTRLCVSEVVFPYSIPNVGVKTNKILVNIELGPAAAVQVTIPVPSGFYTPAQLAAQLTSLINAAATGLGAAPGFVTITYGVSLGYDNVPVFTYNVGDPINNKISFEPMPNLSSAYPYPATTKQLFDLLGFTTGGASANNVLSTVGNGVATFCQAIRYVDIVCPQLVQCQSLADATTQEIGRNALCRIYLCDGFPLISAGDPNFAPPGTTAVNIYRQFSNPKFIQWNAEQNMTSTLTFQVYDDAGALLSESDSPAGLSNGSDWSMTILASEN